MSQTMTVQLQDFQSDHASSRPSSTHTRHSISQQDAQATTSSILAPVISVAGGGQGEAASTSASNSSVSRSTTAIVILTTMLITAIGSFISGILTVAIPSIAIDIGLAPGLILWPSSIYHLVCACTLLIAGSVSDACGAKPVYLMGCFLQAIFTLASGLSRTGTQMIVFRAFSGLALSFCLPSSVSIITGSLPAGKRRNVAFAAMGGGQPVGFALGLTLGGVFTQTIGWQAGFYVSAVANIIVVAVAWFGLPAAQGLDRRVAWHQLKNNIDWIGGGLASAALALVSYVLAATSTHSSTDRFGTLNIVLLCVAAAIVPAFIFWMRHQTSNGRPALIPNSIWKTKAFTPICFCVVIAFGTVDGLEQMLTLYFQYVRHIKPLDTSLRFLPMSVSGTLYNIFVGLVAHRISGHYIMITACTLAIAPAMLMLFAAPDYAYWAMEFPTVLLSPIAIDTLYTISALLITASFPASTQGLAGGVFNTCVQLGQSIGLALSAVVANRVTAAGDKGGILAINGGESRSLGTEEEALLRGYRASFLFFVCGNIVCVVLVVIGLRRIGKVGRKAD